MSQWLLAVAVVSYRLLPAVAGIGRSPLLHIKNMVIVGCGLLINSEGLYMLKSEAIT